MSEILSPQIAGAQDQGQQLQVKSTSRQVSPRPRPVGEGLALDSCPRPQQIPWRQSHADYGLGPRYCSLIIQLCLVNITMGCAVKVCVTSIPAILLPKQLNKN